MKSTYESKQVQLDFTQRYSYEESLKVWLRDYEFKYFFTLTFRLDVSVSQARKTLDHFAQRLSKKAYGGNWNSLSAPTERISFVAGLEHHTSNQLHWHVAMQSLNHSRRLLNDVAVELAVRESWSRCNLAGRQFDFKMINRTEDRVVSYLLKEVKYDTDTFYEEWFSPNK